MREPGTIEAFKKAVQCLFSITSEGPEARQPPALRMIRMSNRCFFPPSPSDGHLLSHLSYSTSSCYHLMLNNCLLFEGGRMRCMHKNISNNSASNLDDCSLPVEHMISHSPCTHARNYTLNRCPVGLNFSVSLPLIFDVPCIALIMYLASVQMWQW